MRFNLICYFHPFFLFLPRICFQRHTLSCGVTRVLLFHHQDIYGNIKLADLGKELHVPSLAVYHNLWSHDGREETALGLISLLFHLSFSGYGDKQF